MKITRELLAKKILDFLNRKLSHEELTVWAEDALIDSDYQEEYFDVISDALAHIGISNVKSFELPIAFYLNILIKLDFLTIFGLEPTTEKTSEIVYV